MRTIRERISGRREFFRAAARYGLLAMLAAASVLIGRSPRRLAGQRCVNRGVCSGCGLAASCGLPAALSARRTREGGIL